jgi:hypothetical protein
MSFMHRIVIDIAKTKFGRGIYAAAFFFDGAKNLKRVRTSLTSVSA